MTSTLLFSVFILIPQCFIAASSHLMTSANSALIPANLRFVTCLPDQKLSLTWVILNNGRHKLLQENCKQTQGEDSSLKYSDSRLQLLQGDNVCQQGIAILVKLMVLHLLILICLTSSYIANV